MKLHAWADDGRVIANYIFVELVQIAPVLFCGLSVVFQGNVSKGLISLDGVFSNDLGLPLFLFDFLRVNANI